MELKLLITTVKESEQLKSNLDQQNQNNDKPEGPKQTRLKKQIQQAATEHTHTKKINGKFRPLCSVNGSPKQEFIWSRKNFKANSSSNYKYQLEINQVKERKLNY